MTTNLPDRLRRIADEQTVLADAAVFLDSVAISDADRSMALRELAYSAAQIRGLADAMQAPEDAEELYGGLAALWLELRLQWQRHNDVANYDLMRNGAARPIDLVRGSVSSYLFERIESLLSAEHLDRLNDKALTLIDTIREDVASPSRS